MTTDTSFTAKDVMKLRQRTGLGMMDCKAALTETNGDMDAAEELLRQKLKGKMAGRTERATGQGLIAVAVDGANAAIVEVRTETDFTASNNEFKQAVADVAKLALRQPAGDVTSGGAIADRIDDIRIKTGENVNFARGERFEGGSFGYYIHHDGKRAALIQYEGTLDKDLATGICQHIVAHVPPPVGIDQKDVPAKEIDQVRQEALAESNDKPPEIAQKIAEGRVRKYLEEKTLLNQPYVKDLDGKKPVRSFVPEGVTIRKFVRYTVGADG